MGDLSKYFLFLKKLFFLTFIYYWDNNMPLWERQSMSRGGAKRRGDTESEAGSRLQAVSPEPDTGSNTWTVRSRSELKLDAQPTEPPRRPCVLCLQLHKRVHPFYWSLRIDICICPPPLTTPKALCLGYLSVLPSASAAERGSRLHVRKLRLLQRH